MDTNKSLLAMMRFSKALLIVAISSPLVLILIVVLVLARRFYVKNRYEVQAISMEWIDPMEPGLSGCVDFQRNIQPTKLQGLGILLALDLKLVSDSTEGTHRVGGILRQGVTAPRTA